MAGATLQHSDFLMQLRSGGARYRVLRALRSCRGHRAYPESLLSCLDGEQKTSRRLHNTCTTLFQRGLLEKVRGMYQLTPAGLEVLGAQ